MTKYPINLDAGQPALRQDLLEPVSDAGLIETMRRAGEILKRRNRHPLLKAYHAGALEDLKDETLSRSESGAEVAMQLAEQSGLVVIAGDRA